MPVAGIEPLVSGKRLRLGNSSNIVNFYVHILVNFVKNVNPSILVAHRLHVFLRSICFLESSNGSKLILILI